MKKRTFFMASIFSATVIFCLGVLSTFAEMTDPAPDIYVQEEGNCELPTSSETEPAADAKRDNGLDVSVLAETSEISNENGNTVSSSLENTDMGETVVNIYDMQSASGSVLNGWNTDETLYYMDGQSVKGQIYIDGYWYCFDLVSGRKKTGFTALTTAYENSGAKTVYYDDEGKMLYGQHYLRPQSGADYYWYCFDLTNGAMKTGETSLSTAYQPGGAKTVYYNSYGQMQYGEQKVGAQWKYYDLTTGACISNQLITISKSQDNNGQSATYYFGPNGVKYAGELYLNGNWKYFNRINGNMAVGKTLLDKSTNNIEASKTVWYDSNGNMLYGQQYLNGAWHCFDLTTGNMFANGEFYLSLAYQANGPKTVRYDSDGCMIYGQYSSGDRVYSYDSVTGAKNSYTLATTGDGTLLYNFDGIKTYGQMKIGSFWYFFDPENNGYMAQSKFVFLSAANNCAGEKTCYYNGEGHMLYGTFLIGSNVFTADSVTGDILKADVNGISYCNQRDSRWNTTVVGVSTIGNSGCVPTVMAMAVNYLLKTSYTPVQIAQVLHSNGYYNDISYGTLSSGWEFAAQYYGFKIAGSLSLSEAIHYSKSGALVAAAMNPGLFASSASTHEVLFYGYSNGKINVYDPSYSSKNGLYSLSVLYAQKSTANGDILSGGPFFALIK